MRAASSPLPTELVQDSSSEEAEVGGSEQATGSSSSSRKDWGWSLKPQPAWSNNRSKEEARPDNGKQSIESNSTFPQPAWSNDGSKEEARPDNGKQSIESNSTFVPVVKATSSEASFTNGNKYDPSRRLRLPHIPRPYQEKVTRLFFEQATPGKIMRMQLACGTGKTFIYGMLFSEYLTKNPNSQCVVFVPWRDLARQTAKELAEFGLRVAVIGDLETPEIDEDAEVIVCVYNSARHLKDCTFKIKIVDEAHHLDNKEAGLLQQAIREVPAWLSADFTATFKDKADLDYVYSHDQATTEKYVSDVIYWMVHYDRSIEGLVNVLLVKCELWSPMFVVFNKVERARRCAELMTAKGLNARLVTGSQTKHEREEAKRMLRSGELKAICIVGVFNEGVSIDELKAVVFGDIRQSKINVQQLAMRVTRRHHSKPTGSVVVPWPVDAGIGDVHDLTNMVRAMATFSPKFEQRLRRGSHAWFRSAHLKKRKLASATELEHIAIEGARLIEEKEAVFDRLGKCLKCPPEGKWPFDDRLRRLTKFVEANEQLPRKTISQARKAGREEQNWREEQDLSKWLQRIEKNTKAALMSEERLNRMVTAVPLLKDHVGQWLLESILWDQKLEELRNCIRCNNGEVPRYHGAGEPRQSELDELTESWEKQELARWLSTQMETLVFSMDAEGETHALRRTTRLRHIATQRHHQLFECLPSDSREYKAVAEVMEVHDPFVVQNHHSGERRHTWDEMYVYLARWVAKFGSLPVEEVKRSSMSAIDSRLKPILSIWIRRQLAFMRLGRLTQDQKALLRQVPTYVEFCKEAQAAEHDDTRNAKVGKHGKEVLVQARVLRRIKRELRRNREFDLYVTKLAAWKYADGRSPSSLPRYNAEDPEERSLYTWLESCRYPIVDGTLQDEFLEKLLRIDGMEAQVKTWTSRGKAEARRKHKLIRKLYPDDLLRRMQASPLLGKSGPQADFMKSEVQDMHRLRLWNGFLKKLTAWKQVEGRDPASLPRLRSKDRKERSLQDWLRRVKERYEKGWGKLDDELLWKLQRIDGMEAWVQTWKSSQTPYDRNKLMKYVESFQDKHLKSYKLSTERPSSTLDIKQRFIEFVYSNESTLRMSLPDFTHCLETNLDVQEKQSMSPGGDRLQMYDVDVYRIKATGDVVTLCKDTLQAEASRDDVE